VAQLPELPKGVVRIPKASIRRFGAELGDGRLDFANEPVKAIRRQPQPFFG
jgi:hypothetical protein